MSLEALLCTGVEPKLCGLYREHGDFCASMEARCRPLAAIEQRAANGSNAAGPVSRGHTLNSRSRPLSGHSNAHTIAAPTTVSRYCGRSASPARCNASLRAAALSMPTRPAQMADRMSAVHGAELTHPTRCGLSRSEEADTLATASTHSLRCGLIGLDAWSHNCSAGVHFPR